MYCVQEANLQRATEIIRDIDFPTLPLYLQMIQTEMRSETPSFPKIAGLVSQDMALTAKLLKTVNSVAFARRSQIENPLQALTVLGQEQFYTAVLSEALRNVLDRHALSAENFAVLWKHATETATICKFIAEKLTRSMETQLQFNANHAYLAGLFHDCGIPVMASRFPEYEKTITLECVYGKPLSAVENDHYECDHSILCYIIAKAWELPIPVRYAIYAHHSSDLGYSGEQSHRELAVILRIAESFAFDLAPKNHPFLAEACGPVEIAELCASELHIDEDTLVDLFNDLREELAL